MNVTLNRWIAGIVGLLMLCSAGCVQAARTDYDRVTPRGKLFADVVLDLEYSIGRHNFAVVGHNEIGQAVRRRGYPNFGDAAIVHFCNLTYARQVMDIQRSLILYMPCRVAVFTEHGRVHAASLLLPLDTQYPAFNRLAARINAQLREIVDDAVAANAVPDNKP